MERGATAGLFGFGLLGFQTVPVEQYGLFGFPQGIPLAEGLSLTGTTGYSKLSPNPAPQCLTTSLDLFTNCQPFLMALTQNGGTISKPTILSLLQVAQNKTADVVCANSVLDFLNQGCVCSLTVYNTLQAFPTTTVPQLLKQGVRCSGFLRSNNGGQYFTRKHCTAAVNLLAHFLCPTGLVLPAPPAAAVPATTAAGTMSMVPLPTAGR